MIGYMPVSDIVELVALCAIVFIPLGYFAVPAAGRFFRWVEWEFGRSAYFKRQGTLGRYAGISGESEKQGGKK